MRLERRRTFLWLSSLSFVVSGVQSLVSDGSLLRMKHKRLALDVLPSDVEGAVTNPLDGGSSVNSTFTFPLSSVSIPIPSLNSGVSPLTSLLPLPSTSSSTSSSSALPTTVSSSMSTPTATSQAATSSTTTSTTSFTYASNTAQPGTQIITSTFSGNAPVATTPNADSGSTDPGDTSDASPSVSPSSSSTTSSSSGFFSNTGAVAGTFTIIGLVGVAGVIGLGMLFAKRRHASQFDDDVEFLEKTQFAPEPPQQPNYSVEDEPTLTEMGHYGEPMAVAPPPAAYYPDYGYGTSYVPDAQAYYNQGVYPPAHSAAAYTLGHQEMPNPHCIAEIDLGPTRPEGNDLSAVQPSVRPSTPHPVADFLVMDDRLSVDSFYTGMGSSTETPGGAL